MPTNQKETPANFTRMTCTTRGFAAPWNYVQGPGEFDNLPFYSRKYSDNVYALIDGFLYEKLGKRLEKAFAESGATLYVDRFNGECCQKEIDRATAEIQSRHATLCIAIGGGKTIDTCKVAAMEQDIHLIVVPTSASNDAPVSSLAVVYTEEGVHDHSIIFNRGSDMVLIDSQIILDAPRRLLVAGMGDALCTYFESCACERTQMKNGVGKGYLPCKIAMAIAKLSYDILMEDSVKALAALESGVITEAFENVIEANALLSGLGFQNTGCSIPHALNAGLSELPEAAGALHGERVAFGLVVQMLFENRPMAEIRKIMDYMAAVGLPLTLRQLGVEPTMEKIHVMTDKMVYHNRIAYSQEKVINEDTLAAAIKTADTMGAAYLNGKPY